MSPSISSLDRSSRSPRRRFPAAVETLEDRQLLSAVLTESTYAAHQVRVEHQVAVQVSKAEARLSASLLQHQSQQSLLSGNIRIDRSIAVSSQGAIRSQAAAATPSPVVGAYNPTQVRTAYGVNLLPPSNQGQGVTIGIVDVYNDPAITNDISVFSTQYGLPQLNGLNGNPTFTINNAQNASNSPSNGGSSDTTTETALDVEWVHSIAPYANIVLVYANSFQYSSLLSAVQTAVGTPGVVAVSVSYGSSEFSGETGFESYFVTPTGNNTRPVAIDFSTGDSGFPSFPATSTSVLGVGGTSLYTSSSRGKYSFETGWGGLSNDGAAGGGISSQYSTPTFQSSNGVNFGRRSIPDVSAIADPITGVSVYNSYDTAVYGTPWRQIGGTSLSCPVVSGMIAEAQQNRIAAGLTTLSSPQINAKLYGAYNSAAYSTDFNDVTIGNNHNVGSNTAFYSASTGYDLATGIGSPKTPAFVNLLST